MSLKNNKLTLIDCSFNFLPEFKDPGSVMEKHKTGYGYVEFIRERLDVTIIEHIAYKGEKMSGGVRYRFFRGSRRFMHIPFGTLRYIRRQRPDIVILQGFHFPIQALALRWMLGKKCLMIAQHHGEEPFTGIKKRLQQIAGRCMNAYLFTAQGNASAWIENKIILGYDKCYESLEASTYFGGKDRAVAKQALGLSGTPSFLWVGRLNTNKDPLTVLTAFERYLIVNPLARLYMIYQEEALLNGIRTRIDNSAALKKAVCLQGAVPHEALPAWYSAADFYISGSHREGSGYALLEAMACGCVPVVTAIPSFRKMTADGAFGFLYRPGDVAQLLSVLISLSKADRDKLSEAVIRHFGEELSFKGIADRLFTICCRLLTTHYS